MASGQLLQQLDLTASQITACATASDEHDSILFITSAALDTSDEPEAGDCFEVSIAAPAIPAAAQASSYPPYQHRTTAHDRHYSH